MEITNYRPIALFVYYIECRKSLKRSLLLLQPKITKLQYAGFVKGNLVYHSFCQPFQLCMTQMILETRSSYLDIRKAFDSAPHKELLFKLWKMGITGDLWLWFINYLTKRVVSRDLSWNRQYSHICAYKALHVIRRSVPLNSSVGLKKQLFTSLVKFQ